VAVGQASQSGGGAFSGQSASASSSRAASASSARSASAYSARSNYADRTAVDAEVHDDVSYHSHVVYQQPPRDADADGIMAALSEGLTPYDVQTANPWPVLSAYFNGRVPRYDDLKRDPRFDPFIRSLAQRSTPFFMGGTFSVAHGLTDPASGQVTCSGTLDAVAFASADGRQIGKAQARAEAMGQSPDLARPIFLAAWRSRPAPRWASKSRISGVRVPARMRASPPARAPLTVSRCVARRSTWSCRAI
jgi:hypothetical protein